MSAWDEENSGRIMQKNLAQALLSKGGGLFFKKVILPLLPVILLFLFIIGIVLFLIAAVYSAFPQTKTLAGPDEDAAADEVMYNRYADLCAEFNVKDTWLLNDKALTMADGNAYEASPDKPFYPGGGISRIGYYADARGLDAQLKLLWSQVHAATLFYAYTNELVEIPSSLQKKVTADLHPYYYYKKSEILIEHFGEESEIIRINQYLLVEAYTIQGHFQYHYKWEVTESKDGSARYTKEVLNGTQQILPNTWQRFEDWVQLEYRVNEDAGDLALARTAVLEAGEGFDQQSEWLSWLIRNDRNDYYVSQATINADLLRYFKEAEAAYGIPWWFLAAVAYAESSFKPQAENMGTGCYGLMQLTPSNWLYYSSLLGFDPVLDKDNPHAQIMCGAYMLKEQGLKAVNWESPAWQEQTLGVLVFYGGYRGADAFERGRTEYAANIWRLADEFKNTAIMWPVPGYNTITSKHNEPRTNPSGAPYGHEGVDIAVPEGTTVYAAALGKVVYAGWQSAANHSEGYGLYVKVNDQNNTYVYAHLSVINVKLNQDVGIGTPVGLSGNTGRSSGPHLHFEIREMGISTDPLLKYPDLNFKF